MIFSVFAFVTLIISICIKNRKKSLCIQSLSCLFESFYSFFISAYTGAMLNLISFIRSFLFMNKEKFNKKIYFIMLILFEVVIISNCIYTWNGLISLLPTIGSVIRTYCLWQSNMKYVRLSGVTTGITYGTYYLYYKGWFMVLGYVVLLIIGIWQFLINDIKKQK